MDIIDKTKAEIEHSILRKLERGEQLTRSERQTVLRICKNYLKEKKADSDPRRTKPL